MQRQNQRKEHPTGSLREHSGKQDVYTQWPIASWETIVIQQLLEPPYQPGQKCVSHNQFKMDFLCWAMALRTKYRSQILPSLPHPPVIPPILPSLCPLALCLVLVIKLIFPSWSQKTDSRLHAEKLASLLGGHSLTLWEDRNEQRQ